VPKTEENRSPRRTQWAAQFAVASELCKRGYEVSFTMGNNTPLADLMVISPGRKEMFLVDVKGLYRRNPWLVRTKAVREKLFYILAYVPQKEPNQFFIMTQKQANALINRELKRLNRPAGYRVTGFVWSLAEKYGGGGCWDILPK
jgi:hypothetical protein